MFRELKNPTTGEGWSEKNTDILFQAAIENGYLSNQAAGFKQWIKAGRVVKKGETSKAKIIRIVDKKINLKGKIVKKKVPVKHAMFFIEQTEILEKKKA